MHDASKTKMHIHKLKPTAESIIKIITMIAGSLLHTSTLQIKCTQCTLFSSSHYLALYKFAKQECPMTLFIPDMLVALRKSIAWRPL